MDASFSFDYFFYSKISKECMHAVSAIRDDYVFCVMKDFCESAAITCGGCSELQYGSE